MEIDLNKEADSETSEFENFSIRAYVAEIREKDQEKCWPFESFCDYKDYNGQDGVAPVLELPESRCLFSQNVPKNREASDDVPQHTEVPDLSEVEISKGKEAGAETPTAAEVEISKVNEVGYETLAASEVEISKGNEAEYETLIAYEVEISKGNEGACETLIASEVEISKENEAAFEVEISKGNEVGYETLTAYEVEISKGNKAGSETLAASKLEISKGNGAVSETLTAFELENFNGNEAQSETATEIITSKELDDSMGKTVNDGSTESLNEFQCQNEESVNEVAKTENSVAADNANQGTNLKRRKKRKFRLLSDILRDLAGPNVESYIHFDVGDADNVNSKFTVDIEDDSDGVPLDTFLRKQKGVEFTAGSSCALNKKKKQKTLQVEPRRNEVKRSNPGPEGSETMKKRKETSADTHNNFTTEKLAGAVCSVQLKGASAEHTGYVIPITGTCGKLDGFMPPASVSVMHQPRVEVGVMKGAGLAQAVPRSCGILVCTLNKNPADFSIPNAKNKFMRILLN